jgi:hypothetical protein
MRGTKICFEFCRMRLKRRTAGRIVTVQIVWIATVLKSLVIVSA